MSTIPASACGRGGAAAAILAAVFAGIAGFAMRPLPAAAAEAAEGAAAAAEADVLPGFGGAWDAVAVVASPDALLPVLESWMRGGFEGDGFPWPFGAALTAQALLPEPLAAFWSLGETRLAIGDVETFISFRPPVAWIIPLERGAEGDASREALERAGVVFLEPGEDGIVPLEIHMGRSVADRSFWDVAKEAGAEEGAAPHSDESEAAAGDSGAEQDAGGADEDRRVTRSYALGYLDGGWAVVSGHRAFLRQLTRDLARHVFEPLPSGVAVRLDIDMGRMARRNAANLNLARLFAPTAMEGWVNGLEDHAANLEATLETMKDGNWKNMVRVEAGLARRGVRFARDGVRLLDDYLNDLIDAAPLLGRARLEWTVDGDRMEWAGWWVPEPGSWLAAALRAPPAPPDGFGHARLAAALPAEVMSWSGGAWRLPPGGLVAGLATRLARDFGGWAAPGTDLRQRLPNVLSRLIGMLDGSIYAAASMEMGKEERLERMDEWLEAGVMPLEAFPFFHGKIHIVQTPLAAELAPLIGELADLLAEGGNHALHELDFPMRFSREAIRADDAAIVETLKISMSETDDAFVLSRDMEPLIPLLAQSVSYAWTHKDDLLYVFSGLSEEDMVRVADEVGGRMREGPDSMRDSEALGAREGFLAAYPAPDGLDRGIAGYFVIDHWLHLLSIESEDCEEEAIQALRLAMPRGKHPAARARGSEDGYYAIRFMLPRQGIQEIANAARELIGPLPFLLEMILQEF